MLCYFGHHKCASTWLSLIIYEICSITGLKPYQKQSNIIANIKEEISSDKMDFYISQNSVYSKISLIENYKGFHVIRDPRDIIISGYYSHLHSHSTDGWESLLNHRKELKKLNKEEGLLKEIEFSNYFLNHINNWNYSDPNILELKMEDLTQNTFSELVKILKFLDLFKDDNQSLTNYKLKELVNRIARKLSINIRMENKLNNIMISKVIDKYSFNKLSKGRDVSQENIKSHYRKGVAGDWVNHFQKVHIDSFNNKFPEMIEKLGY